LKKQLDSCFKIDIGERWEKPKNFTKVMPIIGMRIWKLLGLMNMA
jgi:hypothetical protein